MHKIEFGKNIIKQYPESISEMTKEQYISFVRLVLLYQNDIINYDYFSKELVYMLLDMKRRVNILTDEQSDRVLENLKQIIKLNEAFFEIEKGKHIIKTDFLENPIPFIGKYKGPDTALVNTCFGEYVSALNAFLDYSKTKEEQYLNWLIATLYRPVSKKRKNKKIEDTRELFNKFKTAYYAKKVNSFPFEVKYGIYLWFASCQKFIVTSNNLELGGGVCVDLSQLFNSSESSEDGIGMAGIVFDLAESNVFGNVENVEKQPTYDVLVRMVQVKQQAEKMKKNAENS